MYPWYRLGNTTARTANISRANIRPTGQGLKNTAWYTKGVAQKEVNKKYIC